MMNGTEIRELPSGPHTFLVDLSEDDYGRLARIRNARYQDDTMALLSVLERGLVEMAGEIPDGK